MWTVAEWDCLWYVVRGEHVHPIPFESERDAARAAARLNASYSAASSPAE